MPHFNIDRLKRQNRDGTTMREVAKSIETRARDNGKKDQIERLGKGTRTTERFNFETGEWEKTTYGKHFDG